MVPIERMFFVLRHVHRFLFFPKNSKEEEIDFLTKFSDEITYWPKDEQTLLMSYLLQVEPKHDIIHIRFMEIMKSVYSIVERSDFIKSWLKKTQELNKLVNFQWFNDHVNKMTFLLSQIEENERGNLILWLVQASRPMFVNNLVKFVYSQNLVGLPLFEEFNSQICNICKDMREIIYGVYVPMTTPVSERSPIIRRILLLHHQLDTRMMAHLNELQEQIQLEVELELQRLGNL